MVSSYTPTIRALTHARRARPANGGSDGGAAGANRRVLVAMPRTPNASDLPGAVLEAALLRELFPGQVRVLTGDTSPDHRIDPPPDAEATHETVLGALRTARGAHFACHGAAEIADPSASRLLLHDGPLSVVDVARLRLEDAELAFLSACSTARPGDRLADEAIHLASAFQLAGYRHVIGTLWPIGDAPAVFAADDVYTAVTATGDVAGAVHTTTRRLRDRWPDDPSVWASHIHVGA